MKQEELLKLFEEAVEEGIWNGLEKVDPKELDWFSIRATMTNNIETSS